MKNIKKLVVIALMGGMIPCLGMHCGKAPLVGRTSKIMDASTTEQWRYGIFAKCMLVNVGLNNPLLPTTSMKRNHLRNAIQWSPSCFVKNTPQLFKDFLSDNSDKDKQNLIVTKAPTIYSAFGWGNLSSHSFKGLLEKTGKLDPRVSRNSVADSEDDTNSPEDRRCQNDYQDLNRIAAKPTPSLPLQRVLNVNGKKNPNDSNMLGGVHYQFTSSPFDKSY